MAITPTIKLGLNQYDNGDNPGAGLPNQNGTGLNSNWHKLDTLVGGITTSEGVILPNIVTTSAINAGAVTNDKIANNIIMAGKINSDAIETNTMNMNVDGRIQVKSLGIGTAQLQDNAVTSAKILDSAVITSKINTGAVTDTKLGANAVVSGKIALSATDNSTLEVNAGILRVKAIGVDTAQIKDNAVTTAKILNDNVTTAKILDRNVTANKIETDCTRTKANFTFTFNGTINNTSPYFKLGEIQLTANNGIPMTRAGSITKVSATIGNGTVVTQSVLVSDNSFAVGAILSMRISGNVVPYSVSAVINGTITPGTGLSVSLGEGATVPIIANVEVEYD